MFISLHPMRPFFPGLHTWQACFYPAGRRQESNVGAGTKGCMCFACAKLLLLRFLKSVEHCDKTNGGADAEPPARAPLRSNTCGEIIWYPVLPWPEQANAARDENISHLAWSIGQKSLANRCPLLNSRKNPPFELAPTGGKKAIAFPRHPRHFSAVRRGASRDHGKSSVEHDSVMI